MQFDIPALGPAPYLTLIGLTLLVALLPVLLARRRTLGANLRSAAVVAALVLPVTLVLGLSMSRNSLELRDGQVVVRAGFFYEYARDIGEFDLAAARHGSRESLAPSGLGERANGIQLPGYVAGRFAHGERGALFVALTDSERVVYLPARHGQSLMVSVAEAEQLLQTLYDRAPARTAQLSRTH